MEKPPTGWTPDTIVFHFTMLIGEMNKRLDERKENSDTARETALLALKATATNKQSIFMGGLALVTAIIAAVAMFIKG